MSTKEIVGASTSAKRVTVWDPLIRIGHWTLVAAFTIAYVTAEEEANPDALHVWSGYVIGVVILLRIIWGLIGSQHARFADFVTGPAAALGYLGDLLHGRSRRYLGHSPAGGAMVIALLLCLAATVVTGIVAYGERGQGPLAGMSASAPIAKSDGEDRDTQRGAIEENESAVGALHATLANITLVLILLHISGVLLASLVHRENLIAAMITGKKRADH